MREKLENELKNSLLLLISLNGQIKNAESELEKLRKFDVHAIRHFSLSFETALNDNDQIIKKWFKDQYEANDYGEYLESQGKLGKFITYKEITTIQSLEKQIEKYKSVLEATEIYEKNLIKYNKEKNSLQEKIEKLENEIQNISLEEKEEIEILSKEYKEFLKQKLA